MRKFADMSGAGCVIRVAEVPIAEGATLEEALTSGEEAELVCTGPEEVIRSAGLQPIGTLTQDPAVRLVGADELPVELKVTGYDHFA
jgi:thiamine monophosphate kinase